MGEFCLRAVAKNSSVLNQIEGAAWKQNRGFLLEAIAKNSAVFKHIDVSLKKDEEFCLQAMAKNSNVLNQIDEQDQAFLLEAMAKNSAVFKKVNVSDGRCRVLPPGNRNEFRCAEPGWRNAIETVRLAMR